MIHAVDAKHQGKEPTSSVIEKGIELKREVKAWKVNKDSQKPELNLISESAVCALMLNFLLLACAVSVR